MIYSIAVKQSAQDEALGAYLYYDEIRVELGTRFLKELSKSYDLLRYNPQHYSFVSADKEKTLRSLKLKSFPYIIIYDFLNAEVVVYSIHNCHKKIRI